MPERVVVAMSGGVDSSVAAALLAQEGCEVIGVSMRLWNGEAGQAASGCCSLDDFLDARRVAHRLGIPFYVWDFREEFERSVVAPFVADYAAGRTPNPCVGCNQHLKFGALWERARELGATAVATGHYARLGRGAGGGWELRRGADPEKDQSYFLFSMRPEMLPHARFPVGHLRKSQVRALAADLALPVASKPDSQEVCFAPGPAHREFVAARLGAGRPSGGKIVNREGTVVGNHDGIHTVTIGQRRGLGVQAEVPQYVTAVERETATVRIGPLEALAADGLEAEAVTWMDSQLPKPGQALSVKIRSRHGGAPVEIVEASVARFMVRAASGLRAVTPGQAAVLYDGDRVVGGGWIRRAV